MHFLNKETLAHHLDPKHNYLLRTANTFADSTVDTNEAVENEVVKEASLIVVEKESIGRGANTNIPEFLRTTIGILAASGEHKQKDIAEAFNVSDSLVSQAKHGRSGDGYVIPSLKAETDKTRNATRDDIEKLALSRTLATLGILTESDIECLGAKDKADVAMKLSKVADNMRPKDVTSDNRIQVVINAPPVREKVHYDVVEVG
jgi:hypothetical protein